jgi:hypothetical protein
MMVANPLVDGMLEASRQAGMVPGEPVAKPATRAGLCV